MMKFFIRAKMHLEITIASITILSPGHVRIISAEARAASVAPCTAIPTSAFFKAKKIFLKESYIYIRVYNIVY